MFYLTVHCPIKFSKGVCLSKTFFKVSTLQLPGNNLKMTQLDQWLHSDENNEVIMGCK